MADELITAHDCAARWNISESYARRLLAPIGHVDRDPVTGAMRYRLTDADAAHANRPGRGRRLDLEPAILSREDAQKLISDESLPTTHRALWAMMRSGVRLRDALSLDVRDVLPDESVAVVETPVKGRTGRIPVPLNADALELARRVIADRAEGPLLESKKGRPLSRYMASRFAEATAGVPVHAFMPAPHVYDSTKEYVRAKDLVQGDTIQIGDLSGIVDKPPVLVSNPDGGTEVSFTFRGTPGSVTWDGDLWVAISRRDQTTSD
ncbi:hypothetical protein [Streptomyces sp. NPDC056399]|uniref:hypothetical protein n=1 Tax=Streptomyces sp. NPDC056399 TaxID=3345807 RepID=UPI0035DFFA03